MFSFIYQLKHLIIEEESDNSGFVDFTLFEDDCSEKFDNLESLQFRGRFLSNLTTCQLKSVKNLKTLTLSHVDLNGIDVEFNYLTEASFSYCKIPEDIVNFYNLKILLQPQQKSSLLFKSI